MSPTCAQETGEVAMLFHRGGSGPGLRDGTASSTAGGACPAWHRRSGVTKRSSGPSGEGLASEPWGAILLPGTSRFKRWRKGPAQGTTQPKSLSVKSPILGRRKPLPKLHRRPPACLDVGGVEDWSDPNVGATTGIGGQARSEENDDLIITKQALLGRRSRKSLCLRNWVRYT